jgi:type I restriction enzyme, S subunit
MSLIGIDDHGNLRSEETHQFKDSSLGRIPVEREVNAFGDVGEWYSGGTPCTPAENTGTFLGEEKNVHV